MSDFVDCSRAPAGTGDGGEAFGTAAGEWAEPATTPPAPVPMSVALASVITDMEWCLADLLDHLGD